MPTMVFINLPVDDLPRSTAFYEALGWSLNPTFSDANASCIVVSDTIFVMLLTHEFFGSFVPDHAIADARSAIGAPSRTRTGTTGTRSGWTRPRPHSRALVRGPSRRAPAAASAMRAASCSSVSTSRRRPERAGTASST